MTSTIAAVTRTGIAALVCAVVSLPCLVCAQDPPPRIPWFALDLHGTIPRFPSTLRLADSRQMMLAELPGAGLGLQASLHLYPVRWRGVTFGIGVEAAGSRSRSQPPRTMSTTSIASGLRAAEEKFLTAAPQLSFNFGTGNGWSYLSGGIGLSQWSLIPEGQEPWPSDVTRLKTINYGGGARWFAKPHLAFSFDVRFYAINPGPPYLGHEGSPRTTLMTIGAGISLK